MPHKKQKKKEPSEPPTEKPVEVQPEEVQPEPPTSKEEVEEQAEMQREEDDRDEEVAEALEEEKPEPPPPPITLDLNDQQRKGLRLLLDMMHEIDIEEATFHYEGNLKVKQLDPSHVVMVVASIDLGKGLNGDVERTFTLNINGLTKALKLRDPTINVETATATVTGKVGYGYKSAKVTLPLLNPLVEEFPEPKVNLSVETEIDYTDLKKALNVLAEEPSHLTFNSDGKHLTITGNGDVSSIEVNGFDSRGEGKACYSWAFLKALKNKTWIIQYSKDGPLKARRTVTDYHYQGTKRIDTVVAELVLWLAPRIEVD